MNTTPAACFKNRSSAEEARKHLTKKEIESDISVETHEDHPEVFVLKVPRDRVGDAVDILAAFYSGKTSSDGVIVCPSCGSPHVDFPAVPRQSVTAYVVERVAEMVHAKEKSFYCRRCNYVWS